MMLIFFGSHDSGEMLCTQTTDPRQRTSRLRSGASEMPVILPVGRGPVCKCRLDTQERVLGAQKMPEEE